MEPLTFNAYVTVAVILYFLVRGASFYREIKDEESYFLYDRKLLGKEYSPSFAAASTSLATVVFFFITLCIENGIHILFAPLIYILGCYLYCKLLLPGLERQGFFVGDPVTGPKEGKPTIGTTLGNYMEARYDSKAVKISIIIVTILGLISILLIELFVGVTIFSVYVKVAYVDWALLVIAFVIFAYTGLGGLLAVIQTDKHQLKLIFFSTIIFLIWLVWQSIASRNFPSLEHFIVHPLIFKGGVILPYPILFNIFIVNLFLVPALLRTWQMAAASPKAEEVKKGIMNGVWMTTGLTTTFILIGIFFFRSVFPHSELSLIGILNSLYTSHNFFAAYIVFPLFFAACLAALISTADSALIPVLQSLFQDFRKSNTQRPWKHRQILLVTAVLLGIAMFLYYIIFRVFRFDLMRWLFTIFSFLIVCTPSIIFAVIAPDDIVRTKWSRITALISIWGSLIVAMVLSYVGNKLKILEIVQLNSPLAALFGCLCFMALWILPKIKRAIRREGK